MLADVPEFLDELEQLRLGNHSISVRVAKVEHLPGLLRCAIVHSVNKLFD